MAKKSTTEAIYLPSKVVKAAREKLEDGRGLELETYLSMYLRIMLRSKNNLTLTDVMPFGKFSGEIVEDVVRAEPTYIAWLISQGGKTSFDPSVIALCDDMKKLD